MKRGKTYYNTINIINWCLENSNKTANYIVASKEWMKVVLSDFKVIMDIQHLWIEENFDIDKSIYHFTNGTNLVFKLIKNK